MTQILGLSGKRQSGKNTSANWLVGQQMIAANIVSYIRLDKQGRLVVPAVVNDELTEGVLDLLSTNPDVQEMLAIHVWPDVKLYSFADKLKQLCVEVFGLTYEQVNGTNEQKNAPTKYKWSDFRAFISHKTRQNIRSMDDYMTGRNVLQVVGTDIFRRIYGDVWVDACLRQIQQERPSLAIITDCRFPNEVEGVRNADGKVIRLLRAPCAGSDDEHESETALDGYDAYDYVCDNTNMSIEEQNADITQKITEWGFNTWEWVQNDNNGGSHE